MADIADQAEKDRLAAYARAWAAYDGEAPRPLEVDDDGYDDNVRLDYAAVIVDKGVSFGAGKGGVTFQLEAPAEPESEPEPEPEPEDEPAEGEPPVETAAEKAEALAEERLAKAQEALDAAWPEEQRIIDHQKLMINGGVCGHAWLRLYEDGRVSVLDPANCTAEWNPDDIGILDRYLIEWTTLDDEKESLTYGLGVLRRKRIEPDDPQKPTSWVIYDEEHDTEQSEWHVIDETPWDHPYAPVLDCQNLPAPNTYYGRSDLEPAILDLLEQMESVASDMRRMVRLMGHPIPVFFGTEPNQVAALDVAIGKVIAIPGDKGSLAQLQIAELTSSLELYQELKTALLEATRIPKVSLGETQNAGPISGVALEVEYEPLIEKTETKRLLYGPLLTATAERILDLAGFGGWTVSLGWPELLPSDPQSEALADEGELRMGIVSKQTIAEKRGYDWSVESQRLEEEKPSFDAGEPELPNGGLFLPGGKLPGGEGGEE
jgi:Phage portal protein, SPP1 Gp6-like